MPVGFVYSEAAVDNHSAGCSSSPDTALPNMGEMKYDKRINIFDHDEKCSALANFDGLVTMGDKNDGRPDGQGDAVAANPKKCVEINGVTDLEEVKGTAELGPLQVQEGNSGEGFLRFEELLGSEKDPGKQWSEGNSPKRSKVSHDLETSEWQDSQDVLQRETKTRLQSYEDVSDETARMKHAMYMGKQVTLSLDSKGVPIHRAQRGTSVTPIKEPPLITKQVFKNLIPSKLNKGKRGGLSENEGALGKLNGIGPLKLRNQPWVQKGAKSSKLPTDKMASVGPREIERHRFWKRARKKIWECLCRARVNVAGGCGESHLMGQDLAHVGGSWHGHVKVRRLDWCVPPSGSKQGGGVCGSVVPHQCSDPEFSTGQVEGLQGVYNAQRKLAFQSPHSLIKSTLGPGARGFLRDPGGMKSPVLGPDFEIYQHTDWSGVCWPICRHLTMVLGSTLPRRPGLQGRTQSVQVSTEVAREAGKARECRLHCETQRPESEVADRSQESSMREPEQWCCC